jgi:hypothetical protein
MSFVFIGSGVFYSTCSNLVNVNMTGRVTDFISFQA